MAAENKDGDDLNATILNFLPGELFSYKSVDTVTNIVIEDIVNYHTEFSNTLDLPALSPYNLQLKVRSVVIMRYGTRLAVKKLLNNVIEVKITKGKYNEEDVLIFIFFIHSKGFAIRF